MNAVLLNRPADPATLFAEEADDLFMECKNWLDGEPIETEAQADAVSSLLNRLRRLSKDADEARKVEAKPFDDGKASVQAKWKPILSKADLAAITAKQALAPYLHKVEERNAADAVVLREIAAKAAQDAATAHQAASGNLDAAERAEALLKAAGEATKEANRADKQKAHAKGGERAIGLVDVYTPVITDAIQAARHYWKWQPDAFTDFLMDQARKDVRSGVRAIPGFEINHERNAR